MRKSAEEQGYARYGNQCADDLSHRDSLMVDERIRNDDENRRKRHERRGNARLRILHGHQRQRHADERAKEGGERGECHPLAVVNGTPHLSQFFPKEQQHEEANESGYGTDVRACKRHQFCHLRRGIGRDGCRIMIQSYLTQHKAYDWPHQQTAPWLSMT